MSAFTLPVYHRASLSDSIKKVVVPTASSRTAPATMADCALDNAIIFKAPLKRVRVEIDAMPPLASATAVTDFASATGAA